jgi:hypothetical protein
MPSLSVCVWALVTLTEFAKLAETSVY